MQPMAALADPKPTRRLVETRPAGLRSVLDRSLSLHFLPMHLVVVGETIGLAQQQTRVTHFEEGDPMSDEQKSGLNVVVVSFVEDSKAYEALTSLKELNSQHQLELRAAAVVLRDDDGKVTVKDEIGGSYGVGTASGGIIGLLIGVIGGPLGVLIGGATGLLAGSLFDLNQEFDTKSALSQISHSVQVGHAALLAELSEPSPEVLDSAMARLSGKVLRRPVHEVESEIAAAEEAQKIAAKDAREQLHKERHEQHQHDVDAKIEELKAKLHRHKKETAAQST